MPISAEVLDEVVRTNNILGLMIFIIITLVVSGTAMLMIYVRSTSKASHSTNDVTKSVIEMMSRLLSENRDATQDMAQAMKQVAIKLDESNQAQNNAIEDWGERTKALIATIKETHGESQFKLDTIGEQIYQHIDSQQLAYESKLEAIFTEKFREINKTLADLAENLAKVGSGSSGKLNLMLESINALELAMQEVIKYHQEEIPHEENVTDTSDPISDDIPRSS